MHLALTILAVFWAWETLLPLVPDNAPAVIHPIIVGALAYFSVNVPSAFLTAAAVAGVVGVMHALVRLAGASTPTLVGAIRFPRRSQDPLPRGVGSRIPELP